MRTYRWWYFAAAVVMAIAVAAFCVAVKAYPEGFGGVLLPELLVCALLAVGFGYRMRAADAPMARPERLALGAAAALGVLTVVLHAVVVPDGLSFWTVVTGVLPALPFLPLAWQSQRLLADV